MKKISPTQSGGSRLLLFIIALIIVSVGAVGTLAAMGIIDLPFLKKAEPQDAGPPPGSIPVPVSARVIPAYTKLSRDHFWFPETKKFSLIYVDAGKLKPGTITDMTQTFGRVLTHEKPAGYAFTEADFLPKGTQPGVAAGVPDDHRRGIVFEAEKMHGSHNLRAGDHIDLIATLPIDSRHGDQPNLRGLVYAPGSQPMVGSGKKANVRIVAQDAVVVTPVTTRQVPTTSSSLTQGSRTTMRPVQEIVIAVDMKELTAVTEALAVDATITCVLRTSRPMTSAEPVRLPEPEEPKMTVVEVIRGGKRNSTVFPGNGQSPIEPASEEKDRPAEKIVPASGTTAKK